MGAQLGNIVFIVWRESIEALLVIGILNAWLSQQQDADVDARRGRIYLWSGVAAGLVAAVVLGVGLIGTGDLLGEDAQQIYQTIIVFAAAALIVQMVLWMRRHGRTLKRGGSVELVGRLRARCGCRCARGERDGRLPGGDDLGRASWRRARRRSVCNSAGGCCLGAASSARPRSCCCCWQVR